METVSRYAHSLPDVTRRDEPRYHVLLSMHGENTEQHVLQVVQRTRGDLRSVSRDRQRCPARLHLHLGARRIDDVVTALEGAGFDIDAIVATAG